VWSRRRQQQRWLDGSEAVVADCLPAWHQLDDGERRVLGELVEWMVHTKRWEAAQGFELTQEIVLTVAAHASLPLLALDRDVYRDVRAVIVHPRTITQRGPRATTIPGVVVDGPQRVLGHTRSNRGPVVISWDAVLQDRRRPQSGHNVVIHELAHKIDVADGLFDGTPEIADRPELAEWVRVFSAELRQLRSGQPGADPVLRAYGAENPSELFAVATEAFFERPLDLEEHKPALYRVLLTYFGQDPAERARWHAAAGADHGGS
jgi:MtfA peptidase